MPGTTWPTDPQVSSGMVVSGGIGFTQLSNAAVQSGTIASGTIGTFHFSSGGILSGNISSGQIGQFHLSSGSITSGAISSGVIGTNHIASGQLTGFELGSGTIVSGRIASGQIGKFHLAQGTIPGGTTFGQVTVDFGTGKSGDVVITSVADTTITTSSRILTSPAYKATVGRDLDELELESFECKGGNIVSGVSFDLVTLNVGFGAGAEGTYFINYSRD